MTYRPGRDDWSRRLRQQEAGKPKKPLGGKAYGSIPHLPGSKFGNRRDRGVPEGEDRLYLERPHPGDLLRREQGDRAAIGGSDEHDAVRREALLGKVAKRRPHVVDTFANQLGKGSSRNGRHVHRLATALL